MKVCVEFSHFLTLFLSTEVVSMVVGGVNFLCDAAWCLVYALVVFPFKGGDGVLCRHVLSLPCACMAADWLEFCVCSSWVLGLNSRLW